MQLLLLTLVCCAALTLSNASPISVSIDTANGVHAVVTGEHADGVGSAFLGIRYAQTPVGALRFKNAVRLDPSGNISAIAYAPQCVQTYPSSPARDDGNNAVDGEGEDCLGLNIYTPPNVNASSKLPILFWIHGGGLVGGSGQLPMPGIFNNLINRGPLIMVSINYRLGPFGFFSSRDSAVPGNAGFSDQIEALLWVRRYISFFGGDPSQVTISGESAGAESVSALTLAPAATGLFSRAIQQSGSAFGTGLWSYSEKTRSTSRQLAELLNCSTGDQWDASSNRSYAVDCLRKLTADNIQRANGQIQWYGDKGYLYKWGPVQEPILFPYQLESVVAGRKPIPVLAGVCGSEWLGAFEYFFYNNDVEFFTLKNVTTQLSQANEMTYWDNTDQVMTATLNNYFYSVNALPNDYLTWANQTIEAWSDMLLTGPLLREMGYYAASGSKAWLYSFDYLSPNALPFLPSAVRGVPHAWDVQYMQGVVGTGDQGNPGPTAFTPTQNDYTVQNELFGQIWSNFVVYGDPLAKRAGVLNSISSWPTFNFSSRPYLSIQPQPKVGLGFHPSSLFFACTAPTIDGRKPAFCP